MLFLKYWPCKKFISRLAVSSMAVLLLLLAFPVSLKAANRFAVYPGNWNGAIWAATSTGLPGTASIPTVFDVVTINNNVTVAITGNAVASTVTVGTALPGSAVLAFNGSGNISLSVAGNFSINNGSVSVINSTGNRNHTLVIGGNLLVPGGCSFNMMSNDGSDVCDVTFTKNGNASVSGNGSIAFNRVNLVMGINSSNILDVTSIITLADGGLTLISGTFKLSSSSVIVPFTTSANIPATARLWNNGGTINSTSSIDWALAGTLQISAGTVNHGIAADNRIAPSFLGTGIVNISGGSLNCAGRISNGTSAWTYIMTGGKLTVGKTGNSQANYDPFNMDNANNCSFSMSGGTIIISKPGGSSGQHLGYHNTATLGTGFTGGTLQIGDENTPSGSIISIDSSIPIYNLTVNSPNVTARLTTFNSIVINDLSIVTGTFNSNSKNLNVGRHWTNDGAFNPTSSTVTLNGIVPQTIKGSTATTFTNLKINNLNSLLAASTVVLYNDINVTGILTLTRGFLITSTANILTMTDTSSTTGTSRDSYVNGPMRKTGNTAFVFPVGYGNGDKWARIGMGTPTSNSTYTAQYFALPFFNTGSMSVLTSPVLNNVSTKEFWQLDRTTGAGVVNVTLFWEDAGWSGINECSTADIRIARWTGASWENDVNSVVTSGTCLGATSGTVKTSTTMSTYGTLTFGSLTNSVNPLPVELLSFNAKESASAVEVIWTTASEINNDYFEVQRSGNGYTFEPIFVVPGAGNSNAILKYKISDNQPIHGISYYRLRQVDFDGKSTLSGIVAVNIHLQEAVIRKIYPNPAGQEVHVDLSVNDTADVVIELMDASGRKIIKQLFAGYSQKQIILETEHVSTGLYSLRISDNDSGRVLQEKPIMIKN